MTHANNPMARLAIVVTTLLLVSTLALAFSSGPPNGRTNAPGETTCTDCHTSFPLNSGIGSLAVPNLPDSYLPGFQYELTVELSDPDAQRWGFEMTVLDGQDLFAGTLASLDAATQLDSDVGLMRDYLKQTSSGTNAGQTVSNTWTINWTAPPEGTGDVTLYIAGNAANWNFSNSGDRIYTVALPLSEDTNTGIDTPTLLATLHQNTPNPFNPRTEIHFSLESDTRVRLGVYGLDGRLVTQLLVRNLPAGEHAVAWDGTAMDGRPLASGIYVARLSTPEAQQMRRMTLVR